MATRTPRDAEPSFEVLFAQLEERTRRLEQGNLPLEEALKLYEEGAALVQRLRALLAGAELRVQRLHEELGGNGSALGDEAAVYGAFEEGEEE